MLKLFKGLSTDQAPPIGVPFRFFLTAPIFAILIAVIFIVYPSEMIFNRYTPIAIATTHLFTLGVLAMIIFGALQQMLPVLAGAVIKKPNLFASIVHTNLTAGTLALSSGFLFTSTTLMSIGSIMLSLAFGVFFFTIIKLLFKVKYITSTVNAMKIFSIAGLITAVLGLYLLSSYITFNIGSHHIDIANIHISFALFGFAFILVMGVAFQVIPMFYVAQDFSKSIQNKFPRVVFGMLILLTIFTTLSQDITPILNIIEILAIVFALNGLYSLQNRKRAVLDVTLWYWKLSLSSLVISMVLLLIELPISTIAIIISFGFLYALLQGMMYKIVPFLSWFHLSSKGHFNIPNLREYIDAYNIKLQFIIYVSSIVCFLLATIFNQLFLYMGAVLFIVSNILLMANLVTATKSYHRISKLDPMAAFK